MLKSRDVYEILRLNDALTNGTIYGSFTQKLYPRKKFGHVNPFPLFRPLRKPFDSRASRRETLVNSSKDCRFLFPLKRVVATSLLRSLGARPKYSSTPKDTSTSSGRPGTRRGRRNWLPRPQIRLR